MEGELRRRSAHVGRFQRQRVLLTPTSLEFFSVKGQEPQVLEDGTVSRAPHSSLALTPNTTVSEITTESVRGNMGALHKDQFVFKLVIPSANGSNSAPAEHVFSCADYTEAKQWKAEIELNVAKLGSPQSILKRTPSTNTAPATGARSVRLVEEDGTDMATPPAAATTTPTPNSTALDTKDEKLTKLRQELKREASKTIPLARYQTGALATSKSSSAALSSHINVIHKAKWKEVLVTNGLRILAEVGLTREAPCLRVSCRLNASPERAFQFLYNYSKRSQWDGVTQSAVVLNEEEDGHLRTVHCKLRSVTVGGFPMAPRDYVVDSTWRKDDEDGSYIILETSNKLVTRFEKKYVRAQIYALGITLSPSLRYNQGEDNACWLQLAIHASPGGWLAKLPISWGQEWLSSLLLTVVGLREVLDEANFRAVDFNHLHGKDEEEEESRGSAAEPAEVVVPAVPAPAVVLATATATAAAAAAVSPHAAKKFEGSLEMNKLVFNCTAPWHLRSATYLHDKVKQSTNVAMFNLMAMDLLEFESGRKMEHITQNFPGGIAHEYMNQSGKDEGDNSLPFLFVIQFQIPPNLSLVCYFQAKPGAMDKGTRFANLFDSFVHGSDAERDNRFKFIPRIVKGNFVVKSAVGQTPALLGNKLVTTYYSGPKYFEVDVDVGSSSVAGGILGVCKSYASSLAIDMAFLLEAQSDEELPEVLIGALSFQNLNLNMAKKVQA